MNIVKRILKANQGRDPERLAMKYLALRSGPFSFLRGTCHLFYDRLASSGFGASAPPVWSCGDLHLENFGGYKGDNRLVYFDINDFDEAALAPATWELVRLAASMHVGLGSLGMPDQQASALVARLTAEYAQALAGGKAGWVERDTAQGVVSDLLDRLRVRNWVDYLNGRTRLVRKRRRLLVDGRRALPVTEAERDAVCTTVRAFAAGRRDPDFFRVLDVGRRIAGTGSLGVARYVLLVEGHGSPDGNYLFDLKQAVPSSLGRHFKALQPRWPDEAHRIAGVQQRMQAVSAACLHPLSHAGQGFVLRALQPSEDRLPFERFGTELERIEAAVSLLARCLAWAQLRSSGRQGSACADHLIGFAARKKWHGQVAQAAAAMAAQVNADWAVYAAAYDAGQFQVAFGG